MIKIKFFKKSKSIDEEKFLELIESKKSIFYRIAYSYTRNREDALDVVSESVCKAFININKLKDIESFYPWFYKIIANTAISFIRKQNQYSTTYELDEIISCEDNLSEILTVREELNKIDQKYREVLILKFNNQLTFKEIAELIGKSENTIKTNYYRGIELLRERMKFNEK